MKVILQFNTLTTKTIIFESTQWLRFDDICELSDLVRRDKLLMHVKFVDYKTLSWEFEIDVKRSDCVFVKLSFTGAGTGTRGLKWDHSVGLRRPGRLKWNWERSDYN